MWDSTKVPYRFRTPSANLPPSSVMLSVRWTECAALRVKCSHLKVRYATPVFRTQSTDLCRLHGLLLPSMIVPMCHLMQYLGTIFANGYGPGWNNKIQQIANIVMENLTNYHSETVRWEFLTRYLGTNQKNGNFYGFKKVVLKHYLYTKTTSRIRNRL